MLCVRALQNLEVGIKEPKHHQRVIVLQVIGMSQSEEHVKHADWDARHVDENTKRRKDHHGNVAGGVTGLVQCTLTFRPHYTVT